MRGRWSPLGLAPSATNASPLASRSSSSSGAVGPRRLAGVSSTVEPGTNSLARLLVFRHCPEGEAVKLRHPSVQGLRDRTVRRAQQRELAPVVLPERRAHDLVADLVVAGKDEVVERVPVRLADQELVNVLVTEPVQLGDVPGYQRST